MLQCSIKEAMALRFLKAGLSAEAEAVMQVPDDHNHGLGRIGETPITEDQMKGDPRDDLISPAMHWSATPQGHAFWAEACDRLRRAEAGSAALERVSFSAVVKRDRDGAYLIYTDEGAALIRSCGDFGRVTGIKLPRGTEREATITIEPRTE